MAETLASLVARHRADTATVSETLARTADRIRAAADPAIFISLSDEASLLAQAQTLRAEPASVRPLLGIPVAVKDNIDVAGLPTTAACPAFAYTPERDAAAVSRLREAGALIVGKTNLDQFATGLVGVRSPYGTPRNALRADLVPGGSSSGSAVAVARGIVPVALGTDTAGSGRVPAAFNNIVGLKPSLGLVSTRGVVPACRSLDCVSIFALTVADAHATLAVIAGVDPDDPMARVHAPLGPLLAPPPHVRLAIPRADQLEFFGDDRARAAFAAAVARVRDLGWEAQEVDIAACLEAAKLLYEGPWIAERTAAVGDFLARHPAALHPVTAGIVAAGRDATAVDLFRGTYRLRELAKRAAPALSLDAMMVPTVPGVCTLADIAAEPVAANARLGTYTNFVNLLDLAGLAVPASLLPDGTPYGVTFLAPSGRDGFLASLGDAFHIASGVPLGGLGIPHPGTTATRPALQSGEIAIAVVGAHLSGLPLNPELVAHGARLLAATRTAPDYRLFALPGTAPARPGMLRVAEGTGAAIEVETWALPAEGFGHFVAAIPAPLSVGSVRLTDGSLVKGFLVEAEATRNAQDVSAYGGWRAALAAERTG